jgi:DNA-binding SARP family transcriptional activator
MNAMGDQDAIKARRDAETSRSLLAFPRPARRSSGSASDSDLSYLATVLDACAGHESRYRQAMEALLEASRRFAAVTVERAAYTADLESLASILADRIQGDVPMAKPFPALSAVTDEPDATSLASHADLPPLSVTCFGRFTVRRLGKTVELCSSRNGQAILRYLVAQPRHQATMDVLLETFWPDDSPDVARHKLHCAFSALRRTLNEGYVRGRGGGYVLCENGVYSLNPAISIDLDVDRFLSGIQAGERATGAAAIAHFEAACRLVTGPFLPEDLYTDWSQIQRERLTRRYMTACGVLAGHHLGAGRFDEAVAWATRLLEEDRCHEEAHRQIIRAHAGAGRRAEALRQYQRCERVLAEELGVQPMPETMALYRAILHGDSEATRANQHLHRDAAAASGQRDRS